MRPSVRAVPLAVLLAIIGSHVSAQSVAEVVERMYEAVERGAAGVDDYTVVESVMGFESSTYFVKEIIDGRPVFRARSTGTDGMTFGLGDDDTGYGDVFQFGPELIEHGSYGGRESIDGTEVHVLVIEDMSVLDLNTPSTPDDDMQFTATSGRLYVDADRYVPRRMEFEGEATTPDGVYPVSTRVDLLDIRDVQGLLIPHRTVITVDGMQAMMDPEMQAQLKEMEEQLANLPESQRAMVEQMLGPQMEQLRNMMEGGGPMTIESTVSDVRVNTGPPGG